ncbi:MAG: ATP-binding cassette domain-containing protein, partial [Pseudonocardiales bacterium]
MTFNPAAGTGADQMSDSTKAGAEKQIVEVERPSGVKRTIPDVPRAVMTCEGLGVYYGSFLAVRDVDLIFGKNEITALIGPSGCGKSTVIRCLNRMNDLVVGARIEGVVTYHDQNIYARDVDPIEVRRRIGMVFQKPNPF